MEEPRWIIEIKVVVWIHQINNQNAFASLSGYPQYTMSLIPTAGRRLPIPTKLLNFVRPPLNLGTAVIFYASGWGIFVGINQNLDFVPPRLNFSQSIQLALYLPTYNKAFSNLKVGEDHYYFSYLSIISTLVWMRLSRTFAI